MHTTTHHVLINSSKEHFISNYFVGCATNITTVEEIAEESKNQTQHVVYFAVIGSLGAVIILLAFIIVCFAIRLHRIRRRRSNKVQKLFLYKFS